MSSDFEFISCIIADDIRTESNGKHIIVGAYSGAILIDAVPFTGGRVAVRFEVIAKKKKYDKVECTITGPDNTLWAKEESNEIETMYLQFPISFIFTELRGTFITSGEYKISLAMDGPARKVAKFAVVTKEELASLA